MFNSSDFLFSNFQWKALKGFSFIPCTCLQSKYVSGETLLSKLLHKTQTNSSCSSNPAMKDLQHMMKLVMMKKVENSGFRWRRHIKPNFFWFIILQGKSRGLPDPSKNCKKYKYFILTKIFPGNDNECNDSCTQQQQIFQYFLFW